MMQTREWISDSVDLLSTQPPLPLLVCVIGLAVMLAWLFRSKGSLIIAASAAIYASPYAMAVYKLATHA